MKRWPVYLLAVILLWGIPVLPINRISLNVLEPVEIIFIGTKDQHISLQTDTGAEGNGDTMEEAFRDLMRKAKGNLFITTANTVVVDWRNQSFLLDAIAYIRPATSVYALEGEPDFEILIPYIRSHSSNVLIGEVLAGEKTIPFLKAEGDVVFVSEKK